MIRKRISNQQPPEHVSPQPLRRRISRPSSPSEAQDERDPQNDDDLAAAKLQLSYLAEGKRIRDMLIREIGDDLPSLVRESLGNMSSRDRGRVRAVLDRQLGVR